MAIYEYNELDHLGGFQGLRVVRMIGGKIKQKYFPFRRNNKYLSISEEEIIRATAKLLDDKWKAEQKIHRSIRSSQAKRRRLHDAPQNTGVYGISAMFTVSTKWRADEWRYYYAPAFRVDAFCNGKREIKTILVLNVGYDEAWRLAIKCLAKIKKIKAYSHLTERKPNPSIFQHVASHMTELGHNIPHKKLLIK